MTPTQPPSDGNAVDNPGDGNVTIAVVKNDLSHLIRIVEGFIAEQKSINKNLNDSALDQDQSFIGDRRKRILVCRHHHDFVRFLLATPHKSNCNRSISVSNSVNIRSIHTLLLEKNRGPHPWPRF